LVNWGRAHFGDVGGEDDEVGEFSAFILPFFSCHEFGVGEPEV